MELMRFNHDYTRNFRKKKKKTKDHQGAVTAVDWSWSGRKVNSAVSIAKNTLRVPVPCGGCEREVTGDASHLLLLAGFWSCSGPARPKLQRCTEPSGPCPPPLPALRSRPARARHLAAAAFHRRSAGAPPGGIRAPPPIPLRRCTRLDPSGDPPVGAGSARPLLFLGSILGPAFAGT